MITIELDYKEVVPRRWAAIARHGKTFARGDGSSADVACSRAVQNLILAVQEEQPALPVDIETDSREGRQFYVSAGKHGGETCHFSRLVATLEDCEIWEVRYQDGSVGRERSKYLSPVKA